MKDSCREFIDALIQISTEMQAAYQETSDYWSPDEPPVTTLFAALGDRIAENFQKEKADINHRIFQLIEAAMTSDDDNLVTAVATGLIEALIARVSQEEPMRRRILSVLGEQSRKHAEIWLAG
ncbi:MAG: hypothetical protein KBT82_06635 [Marinobacter sp.]|uniref:DUF7674 family protein n=1 Tax=Marinobacter sp. TaxID=50741 RepID=UPI001B454D4B|nr:hypothetical protein [Marinobacter sp.]MBQ0746322.1 hypothetical protein [Marinobacter sp.]MBQ0813842.1 hypothetical protein [Marinobacter sp.]|tara:strand:+ start:359 stop:727 length:369 start_codon:yes stop_codon:yes gene_type:complete